MQEKTKATPISSLCISNSLLWESRWKSKQRVNDIESGASLFDIQLKKSCYTWKKHKDENFLNEHAYTVAKIWQETRLIQTKTLKVDATVILSMNFSITGELVDSFQFFDSPKQPQDNHEQTKYLYDHRYEKWEMWCSHLSILQEYYRMKKQNYSIWKKSLHFCYVCSLQSIRY